MTTMATPTQSLPDAQLAHYNPKSESAGTKRVKSAIFHAVALALTAVVLYPGLWMIASSFKPNSEIGGSNTSLVAPVKVGDGAYIGSGSVITKNVAADALALERSPQEERPGWAAKFRLMMAKRKAKAG